MRKRPSDTNSEKPKAPVKKQESALGKLPPKKMVITKNGIEEVDIKLDTTRKSDNKKYVKVLATETSLVFKEIGDRVAKKELKWSYYTTENNIGVHYYQILND